MKLHSVEITFYLNDKKVSASVHPELTALRLIRDQFHLTGAKEGCAEGDCGACSIAWGREVDGQLKYVAINSCIFPAVKLHGTHVITTEGLADGEKMHFIQQAIVENHATQCGYCTPGIVMSLFCLLANNPSPNKQEIYAALEGNLCRCTGYLSITKAADAVVNTVSKNPQKYKELIFPDYIKDIENRLKDIKNVTLKTSDASEFDETHIYHTPSTLKEVFEKMQLHEDGYQIINGGTDIMVQANIRGIRHKHLIDISKLAELNYIKEEQNEIKIGGNTTYAQLAVFAPVVDRVSVLVQATGMIASQQIRNVATIAGNIANASPIGDMACVLLGLNARLVICSATSEREIALGNFYKAYKQIDLGADEIIREIIIPIPKGVCSFEKSSKRESLDIATVNSLINYVIKNKKIVDCRIAFGGVAPTPILAKKAANYLLDKELTESIINEAAKIAKEEFNPISDVRGSDNYRSLLIRNHIIKHLQSVL
ncbi:MAG: FAD binding domain-containing protein [Gammaproteobacteria bacterium]|nr:FAD binding domain-containing protein [Gammaproteobacteria bacterium]